MMSRNNPWSVQAIIDRIEHEKRQPADAEHADAEVAAAGYAVRGLWSCDDDPGTLTAGQAHTALQLHLGCGVDSCWARWRARTALVVAGRMVLDPRAARVPFGRHRALFTVPRMAVFGCGALFFGGRRALR
ncbi:hypothetical protein ACQP1O_21425 [Nocardia sp. CA-151230]|uniref:hypothetical protein n=1 Tax=Nocardia sp. CA-151230 TaxID=3239982 RepID=UPI003D911F08